MRTVVFVGAGHTHLHALRAWARRPPANARLVVISESSVSTYSGMLPGVLAGQYSRDAMEIDVVGLCRAAAAELIIGRWTGLDRERRVLHIEGHDDRSFDVASIGIGSIPTFRGVTVTDPSRLVPVKPMVTFLDRLDHRLLTAQRERSGRPLRIAVVGGGAGGVELALCLPPHVDLQLGGGALCERTLITGGSQLVPGAPPRAAALSWQACVRAGVRVVRGRRVAGVDGTALTLSDGTTVDADIVLWATTAVATPALASLGLPTDARGFPLTLDTLQVISGHPIFVVGDSGTVVAARLPKAGVTAVREGPVLWRNLQRLLSERPLVCYRPRRKFLQLLNTGDGQAIADWRGWSCKGTWCWRLKNVIDRRFVAKFRLEGLRPHVRGRLIARAARR